MLQLAAVLDRFLGGFFFLYDDLEIGSERSVIEMNCCL